MRLTGSQSKYEQLSAIVGARSEAMFIHGGQLEKPAKELIAVVEGPLPEVQAIAPGKEGDTVATVKLDESIGEQATISFWMRSDYVKRATKRLTEFH